MNRKRFRKKCIRLLSCLIPVPRWRRRFRNRLEECLGQCLLSRTACLGNFVYANLDVGDLVRVNAMKGRIDYLMAANVDPKTRVDVADAVRHTVVEHRNWLLPLYRQLEMDFFKHRHIKALMMDSWSELTDQLFVSARTGRAFCNNYRFIDHCDGADSDYICKGLLPIEAMEEQYRRFFQKVQEAYGELPIVYLLFPTKFERRPKFLERAAAIERIVRSIASNMPNMRVLAPDPSCVERHGDDDHPYHFTPETYRVFAKEVVRALNDLRVGIQLKNDVCDIYG